MRLVVALVVAAAGVTAIVYNGPYAGWVERRGFGPWMPRERSFYRSLAIVIGMITIYFAALLLTHP